MAAASAAAPASAAEPSASPQALPVAGAGSAPAFEWPGGARVAHERRADDERGLGDADAVERGVQRGHEERLPERRQGGRRLTVRLQPTNIFPTGRLSKLPNFNAGPAIASTTFELPLPGAAKPKAEEPEPKNQ